MRSSNVGQVIHSFESSERKEELAEKRMTEYSVESFVLKGGGELGPQPEQTGMAGKGWPSEKTQEGPSPEIYASLFILPLVGHSLPLRKAVSTWNTCGGLLVFPSLV